MKTIFISLAHGCECGGSAYYCPQEQECSCGDCGQPQIISKDYLDEILAAHYAQLKNEIIGRESAY
jgi:hypothetical protein